MCVPCGRHHVITLLREATGGVVAADIADNLRAALLCHDEATILRVPPPSCTSEPRSFPLSLSGHVNREFVARYGAALHPTPRRRRAFLNPQPKRPPRSLAARPLRPRRRIALVEGRPDRC
jgi:hypothetical protein